MGCIFVASVVLKKVIKVEFLWKNIQTKSIFTSFDVFLKSQAPESSILTSQNLLSHLLTAMLEDDYLILRTLDNALGCHFGGWRAFVQSCFVCVLFVCVGGGGELPRSDWPGLCLFCCDQPKCVVSQQSWFWAFLFPKFSNFTPPPRIQRSKRQDGFVSHQEGAGRILLHWKGEIRLQYQSEGPVLLTDIPYYSMVRGGGYIPWM